ncbi:MAG: acyl-CoA thioesterase [Bacteroidales bacterium]|nr:acyl-CoA thioesterase [Bacteroidales bacterium]
MTAPTFLPSDNPKVPAAEHPFRHCLPVQIRFTDIDMLGHLNNNIYLSFMDLAKLEYFNTIMPEGLDLNKINMVVVHIDCDFFAPTYFPEALEVWTTIQAVSQRSFRLEQRIVNATTGQTKCIGRTVMAGFDPATATSCEINHQWIAAAAEYEGRPL